MFILASSNKLITYTHIPNLLCGRNYEEQLLEDTRALTQTIKDNISGQVNIFTIGTSH